MKIFKWNEGKNEQLKYERDISFEDVLIAIDENQLLDVLEHHNHDKYPNQKIFVVQIKGYAYLIPFVEDDTEIFLKTIIPSRKATKDYILNS